MSMRPAKLLLKLLNPAVDPYVVGKRKFSIFFAYRFTNGSQLTVGVAHKLQQFLIDT